MSGDTATPPPSANLITLAAGAEWAKTTDRTLRRWIADGQLTGYRVRGRRGIRIDATELAALFQPVPSAR